MSNKLRTLLSAGLLAGIMLVTPACDWFKGASTATPGTETQETSFYLLDANPADIYKDAHIPGALHVTLESIDELSKGWNKNAAIVTYCSPTCGTKDIVAKKLKDAGFNNVKVYRGGITEWYKLSKENKDSYPLEGEAKHSIFKEEATSSPSKESTESDITAGELKNHLQQTKK
ncbi:rhodanese-like domain-containing protein [Candidatus Dependentiae bacterium]|nr:rhodanese-like domain-containing protein [Candidatus Dependentiae bacterium]